MANKMVAEDVSLILLDRFYNKAACNAHYQTTGREILKQSSGKIDYFISCVGTGGVISGVTRQLREIHPDIRVIGIQPRIWSTGSSIEVGAPTPFFLAGAICHAPITARRLMTVLLKLARKRQKIWLNA